MSSKIRAKLRRHIALHLEGEHVSEDTPVPMTLTVGMLRELDAVLAPVRYDHNDIWERRVAGESWASIGKKYGRTGGQLRGAHWGWHFRRRYRP